jgi:hypothetical protein
MIGDSGLSMPSFGTSTYTESDGRIQFGDPEIPSFLRDPRLTVDVEVYVPTDAGLERLRDLLNTPRPAPLKRYEIDFKTLQIRPTTSLTLEVKPYRPDINIKLRDLLEPSRIPEMITGDLKKFLEDGYGTDIKATIVY